MIHSNFLLVLKIHTLEKSCFSEELCPVLT